MSARNPVDGNIRLRLGDTARVEQRWTLAELAAALDRYEAEAETSSLTVSTKQTYVSHARRFVDWLGGGYQFPPEESSGRHRAP